MLNMVSAITKKHVLATIEEANKQSDIDDSQYLPHACFILQKLNCYLVALFLWEHFVGNLATQEIEKKSE